MSEQIAPDALATNMAKLNTSSPTSSGQPSPSPMSPLAGVHDNGTNIGSAGGRKASLPGNSRMSFTANDGKSPTGSRRPSRRGSGVFTSTSGGQQVVFTRNDVGVAVNRKLTTRKSSSFHMPKRVSERQDGAHVRNDCGSAEKVRKPSYP
jgi:hypothetical protein